MGLDELRAKIDQTDRELVALLNRRAELSLRVGESKRAQAGDAGVLEIYQPAREAQVFAHISERNTGPLPDESLAAIYREILSASRALQRPLRIGYLGPVATFTYEAAHHHFGSGSSYLPCQSIADVFFEAEKQSVDYGVVPIENSTGGAVTYTLDQFLDTDLKICAAIELSVTHNLLALGPLEKIERVYSHPQAFAQCRRWLAANLPGATQVETASTSRAAQLIEEESAAAISTESASEIYHVPIVARGIQDDSKNVTRFLVIGQHSGKRTGQDRTAVVFGVQDRVGALQDGLRHLAENHVNLTRIESRPSRRRLWEYVFFVDLDGHPEDDRVGQALVGLSQSCSFVRILGAWPV
ncbi:MAG TPA: prephenate dehydratase [Chloroflexota bacterium]|nr:prephenate dehydratase [Chloroflexota bacterium]